MGRDELENIDFVVGRRHKLGGWRNDKKMKAVQYKNPKHSRNHTQHTPVYDIRRGSWT